MHVIDMIPFWARCFPGRPAIILPTTMMTYQTLSKAIDLAWARIAPFGLDVRQPVAVSIDGPARQLPVCLALLRAGFTVAPVWPGILEHLQTAGINTIITERAEHELCGA